MKVCMVVSMVIVVHGFEYGEQFSMVIAHGRVESTRRCLKGMEEVFSFRWGQKRFVNSPFKTEPQGKVF